MSSVIERCKELGLAAHRNTMEMAMSLKRLGEREPTTREKYLWSHRDESMFLNLLLWQARVPNAKTIVWAHNVHIAKVVLEPREKPFGA